MKPIPIASIMKGENMFKKITFVLLVFVLLLTTTSTALADTPPPDKNGCTKIQDGVLEYSAGHNLAGQPLVVGYDAWGYNYQAHMFSGSYANAYLGGAGYSPYTGNDAAYLELNPGVETHWAWPYRTIQVLMKWDQDWLANVDCNADGKLDRHAGFASYKGSDAWETNHLWGTYEDDLGQTCTWDAFTKIIAVPADAQFDSSFVPGYGADLNYDGTWYAAEGALIGPSIWGEFAVIQDLYNDPCGGFTGPLYLSQDHAGFGGW